MHQTQTKPAWVLAHEDVLGVARERAGLERREGVCLLGALRQRVQQHLAQPQPESTNATAAGIEHTGTEAASIEHSDVKRAGRARYQISVFVCERCAGAFQSAGPDLVAISPAMLAAARCDARHDAGSTDFTHVGSSGMPTPRTTRTIRPSIRRRVFGRAKHRCQVPGCRHTLDLDVHHIVPRADGGGHDPANLIVLCPAHHRANHAGELHVTGAAPDGVTFRHADGTPYGAAVRATSSNVAEKVFNGPRWLGLKETDAKRALQRALAESSHDTEPQTLLKRALSHLGPR
jgi:hypothetical protein